MCDYSLAHYPNRLAVEGEQLVVHRFSSGTVGLASPRQELSSPSQNPKGFRSIAQFVFLQGRNFGCTTFLSIFRRAQVSVRSNK
jgi:hypothetical protein